jgi:hypothetical protein
MTLGVQHVGFTCGVFDSYFSRSSRTIRNRSTAPTAIQPSISTFPCKVLSNLIISCYFFSVYTEAHPRRSPNYLLGLAHFPSTPIPFPDKSFPLNSLADPHPLNSYGSILYKNIEGRGTTQKYGAPANNTATPISRRRSIFPFNNLQNAPHATPLF